MDDKKLGTFYTVMLVLAMQDALDRHAATRHYCPVRYLKIKMIMVVSNARHLIFLTQVVCSF